MTDHNTFRVALAVLFAVFVPFAVYYRARSVTSERLDRWQEGVFILFGLRLSGLPAVVAGLAWLIEPSWVEWATVALPVWLRWFGVALVGCSGLLVVWTFRNLGKNLTDTVVTRKEHSLVTSGPYRYVRHPFYLAGALCLLGVSLVMANWFFLLAGSVPMGFLIARTPIEEAKLVERFGDEYREYMRRVGRFVPRLW